MSYADRFPNAIPFIMEGQVVATDDPDQMGRVRVWIPAIDGEDFDITQLPWADYASPLMGFTVDYPAGSASTNSQSAYGFWAIPKVGSSVTVFFMNGDPTVRCYFAGLVRLHRNRSFPAGRNTDHAGNLGPFGDAEDTAGNLHPIEPAYSNLRAQFQGKVNQSEAITRGAYERQAAQVGLNKDGTEGYSANPADPSYLDPQTYCLVTPGRNAIIMQDDPKFARLRLKTANGHQIIFDDVNERIYVSTATGRSWVELDQDGHINIFGADSISVRSGKDLNFFADGNINLEAGKAINVKADGGDLRISASGSFQVQADSNIALAACGVFDLNSAGGLNLTASGALNVRGQGGLALTGDPSIDVKAGGNIKVTGQRVDINGPQAKTADLAGCPALADSPAIVPGFEPWTREASSQPRGPNWRK